MPMTNIFFVDGIERCLLERKGVFDEARIVFHEGRYQVGGL